jgi:hypothetical protein
MNGAAPSSWYCPVEPPLSVNALFTLKVRELLANGDPLLFVAVDCAAFPVLKTSAVVALPKPLPGPAPFSQLELSLKFPLAAVPIHV